MPHDRAIGGSQHDRSIAIFRHVRIAIDLKPANSSFFTSPVQSTTGSPSSSARQIRGHRSAAPGAERRVLVGSSLAVPHWVDRPEGEDAIERHARLKAILDRHAPLVPIVKLASTASRSSPPAPGDFPLRASWHQGIAISCT